MPFVVVRQTLATYAVWTRYGHCLYTTGSRIMSHTETGHSFEWPGGQLGVSRVGRRNT